MGTYDYRIEIIHLLFWGGSSENSLHSKFEAIIVVPSSPLGDAQNTPRGAATVTTPQQYPQMTYL